MSVSVKNNIWKYYLWRFLCGISLTVPIFVLYLKENGLTVIQIMFLQSIFTISVIIFGIFAGALADKCGRKKVLLISTLVLTFGYFFYGISHTFIHFLLAEIFWAIGDATFFGIGEAFVYDNLKNINRENTYKKVQGISYGISDAMRGFTSIAGGVVAAALSMRSAFFLSSIPASIAVFVAISFKEPKHQKHLFEKNYFNHIKESAKYILTKPQLKFILIFSAVISSLGFISYFLFQLYFDSIGLNLRYIGIMFAILFLSSAIGSRTCYKLEKRFSDKTLLLIIIFGFIMTWLITGITNSIYGIIFGSLMWFIGGVRMTLMPDIINKYSESYHRATILAIGTALANLTFAIISPITGFIVEKTSVAKAFTLIALTLLVFSIYAITFLRKNTI